MMSYRELQELACTAAHEINRQFTNPDDCWSPVAFLDTRIGMNMLHLDMDDEDWVGALQAVTHDMHASKLAVLCEALFFGGPQTCMTLVIVDGERVEFWVAPIARLAGVPPVLGEWRQIHGSDEVQIGGQPVGPLQRSLR